MHVAVRWGIPCMLSGTWHRSTAGVWPGPLCRILMSADVHIQKGQPHPLLLLINHIREGFTLHYWWSAGRDERGLTREREREINAVQPFQLPKVSQTPVKRSWQVCVLVRERFSPWETMIWSFWEPALLWQASPQQPVRAAPFKQVWGMSWGCGMAVFRRGRERERQIEWRAVFPALAPLTITGMDFMRLWSSIS